jgi:hypothetical protein
MTGFGKSTILLPCMLAATTRPAPNPGRQPCWRMYVEEPRSGLKDIAGCSPQKLTFRSFHRFFRQTGTRTPARPRGNFCGVQPYNGRVGPRSSSTGSFSLFPGMGYPSQVSVRPCCSTPGRL